MSEDKYTYYNFNLCVYEREEEVLNKYELIKIKTKEVSVEEIHYEDEWNVTELLRKGIIYMYESRGKKYYRLTCFGEQLVNKITEEKYDEEKLKTHNLRENS